MKIDPTQILRIERNAAVAKARMDTAERAFAKARAELEQAKELHAVAAANLANVRRFLQATSDGAKITISGR
ncbi:hypothetical protein [Mesorhizobium sp. KR1-2]|uniref:hypothetical protein n=1 Tax=Mesorhizobium sp. KR1-2 TaxID=3156609 RepID=UPI0032B4E89F